MIVTLFWTAAAVIAYTYLGYPLWMYLRSRFRSHRWKQAEVYPSVSIIMVVHNGGMLLQDKLDHLLGLNYPAKMTEIIVVSDGSYDGTNEILDEVIDPRVVPVVCDEHRGKAAALNQGIRRATGDVLVFVDIRPRLESGALRQLVSNFADPAVGCAAGELCLHTGDHSASTRAVSGLYWRYEQWIRKCEAAVDSPVGVYGGFYAVRRELVTVLPEKLILDDMYQPLCIVRQGFRSVLDDQARVWDVWPKSSAAEFNRKVRTLAGNYELIQKAPWLLGRTNRLRFQLLSHKLLRLVAPFLFLLLIVANSMLRAQQPYTTLFVGQVLFYGLAAAGLFWEIPVVGRIAGPASAFTLLNGAAVVALLAFLFRPNSLLNLWVRPRPAARAQSDSRNLNAA